MVSLNRLIFSDLISCNIGKLIVCICLCLFTERVSAQYFTDKKESTRCHITSAITGICEDNNGFIWITSQDGLYRYDGNTVINYSRKYPYIFSTNRFASISNDIFTNSQLIIDEFNNTYTIDSLSNIKSVNMLMYYLFRLRSNREVTMVRSRPDGTYFSFSTQTKHFIILEINGVLNNYHYGIRTMLDSNVKQAVYYNGVIFALSPQGPKSYTLSDAGKHNVRITGDLPENKGRLAGKLIESSPDGIPVLWHKGRLYEVSGDTMWHTKLLAVSTDTVAPDFVYYNRKRQVMLQGFGNTGIKEYTYCQYRLLDAAPYASPRNYYYSIIPDGDGFISVVPKAIFRKSISESDTTLRTYYISKPFNSFSIAHDKYHRVWYQVKDSLFCFDTITHRQQTMMSIKGSSFVDVCSAKESDYIYVVLDKIIYRIDGKIKDNSYTPIYVIPGKIEHIKTAFLAGDNELWIGSNIRMVRMNLKTQKVQHIKGFDFADVRTFYRLNDSTVIVGTYNKGAVLLKSETAYFTDRYFSVPVGSANGFVADKLGKLWISSNNGIIRTDIKTLLGFGNTRYIIPAEHFTEFNALASNEFNGSSSGPAVAITDSCLAFANAKGIVLINPLSYQAPAVSPKIIFEGAELFDNALTCRSGTAITLHPIVPYYGNWGNLTISYRIGSNGARKRLSATQEIVLPELAPGVYYLYFSVNIPGIASGDDNVITITVTPQWYQTYWFRTGGAILVILLIVLGIKVRTRYLRNQNLRLQKTVSERTEELQIMLEGLNIAVRKHAKAEEELRESNILKEQYYSLLSHDLQSPVKYLALSIEMAKDHVHELDTETIYKRLNTYQQSAQEIHNLIDKFTMWVRSNDSALEIQPTQIQIAALFHELVTLYEPAYKTKGITLITESDKNLAFHTDRTLLHIILRNSLDNALKYASNGTVTMQAQLLSAEALQIEINNTGVTITPERLQELNAQQYERLKGKFDQHQSLGFQIMALLTSKLNGQYEITSNEATGTRIRFIFHRLITTS